jgi:Uma2 family endonuclease
MHIAQDRYMTPEAYLEWEARQSAKHEYVAGEIFAMVGVTQRHNRLSLNLAMALIQALRDRPCQVFSTEIKLRVAKSAAYYYPDVMVVCAEERPVAGDQSAAEDPVLIVEVLSPSTEGTDRREKLAAYRGLTSVQEYVLVSQDRQQIEIYRRQGDISWLYVSYEPGDEVEFAAVGLRAPIAAFYEGTDVGA